MYPFFGVLLILIFGISYTNSVSISYVGPKRGSLNGETKITIDGTGFSEDQYNEGNTVKLVSSTTVYDCPVHKDDSNEIQVVCYTPKGMVAGDYFVRLSVDEVEVPLENHCGGQPNHNHCKFTAAWSNTPLINAVEPVTQSSLPGTFFKLIGRIFSGVYGSNVFSSTIKNGISSKILRVYANAQLCQLRGENDTVYGIELDNDGASVWGSLTCLTQGTYVGNTNASFIIEGPYGRSYPDSKLLRISRNDEIYMFQTYAMMTDVIPSKGSIKGGTLITISGQYFDETKAKAKVLMGGVDCEVHSLTDSQIVCKTAEESVASRYPGNRGLKKEVFSDTSYSYNNLHKLEDLLTNSTDYSLSYIDHFYFHDSDLDQYSTRTHGFFVPPHSGDYRLYIFCDDVAILYFSMDDDPANKVQIASCPSSANHYFKSPLQESDRMFLEQNKHYYIEVFHSEYSGSSYIKVAARFYDTKFTHKDTGFADKEKQKIEVTSTVAREIQEISLLNFSPGTAVSEVQEVVIVENNGFVSDATYQLGMYGVYTNPFKTDADEDDIAASLSQLPFFDSSESVTVTAELLESGEAGTKLTITFISERGDFPALDYKTNFGSSGESLNVSVEELTAGVPSGNYFTVTMESVPSPLIPTDFTLNQVQTAMDAMFGTRCPEFMTNPASSTIFYNYENNVPGGVSGYRTNEVEPFCGRYSIKNPDYLYRGNNGIKLSSRITTLCFAYQGNQIQNHIKFGYSYEDLMEEMHDDSRNVAATFETIVGWHYTCIDMMEKLKALHPTISYFWIKTVQVFKRGIAPAFYIDDVYIGLEPPLTDTSDINRYRLVSAKPNNVIIQSVSVSSSRDKAFNVTLVPYNCGSYFPLFHTEPGQVRAGMSVGVVRKLPASPPITGTFSVTFKNKTKSGISYDLNAQQLKAMLETIEGIGDLDVTKSGDCANFQFSVTFESLPGDQPEFEVDTSTLHGYKVSVKVTTLQDGGLWLDPIPGDMLRTDHDLPQVMAFINEIPTICDGDCTFEWDVGSTPTVNGISPSTGVPGSSVDITGTNLGLLAADNLISIGGVLCTPTSGNTTSVTCTLGQGSYGTYPIELSVKGKGIALVEGDVTFKYLMNINEISPTTGCLGGGIPLTIDGYGFGPTANVTVGERNCEIINVTTTQILCQLPPSNDGAADVNVTIDDYTETSPTRFQYNAAITSIVSGMNPTLTSVEGGATLRIIGTNFGTSGTLMIGSTEVSTDSFTDTQVTATFPSLPPGTYEVMLAGSQGAAVDSQGNIPTIEYQLTITNVFPNKGSIHGGTRLTLTGQGFSSDLSLIEVTVGSYECDVETASSTQITCVIQDTADVIEINNQGVHPTWGIGYQWDPNIAHAKVGDIINWEWTTPFWLMTFTHRIEQTKNETSTERFPDGFISSQVGSYNGQFRHRVTTPGEFHYWSGYCDYYEIVYYRGTLMVEDRSSFTGEIQLKVAGQTALHNTNSGVVPLDSSDKDCPEFYDGQEDCTTTNTSYTAQRFNFVFDACVTPVVTSIDKNHGTTTDTITITGYGFSNDPCNNLVNFGDAICEAINSTETTIECLIDPTTSPTIGLMQDISLRVNNLGDANIAIAGQEAKTFVLEPVVTGISPEVSSVNGGLDLTITGSGFQGNETNILVLLHGVECLIKSVSYMEITCVTQQAGPGIKAVEVKVIDNGNLIPAVCDIVCQVVYEPNELFTPRVYDVSPKILDGSFTTLTINGTGFGENQTNVNVQIGGETCTPTSTEDKEIQCTITNLPVGSHHVNVVISNKGKATNDIQVTSLAVVSSILPAVGSIHGGTSITVQGNGFVEGSTTVTLGGIPCDLETLSLSKVTCRTRAHSAGHVEFLVTSNGRAFPNETFEFSVGATPNITSISPTQGTKGTEITISGSNFGTSGKTVRTGDTPCEITSSSTTEIVCTAGAAVVGRAPVSVHVEGQGFSNIDVMFEFQLTVAGITKNAGSLFGGQTVTITGSGFDNSTAVTICGKPCLKDDTATQTPSQYVCVTPPSSSSSSQVCDVAANVTGGSKTLTGGYTYDQSLTPSITSVNPPRGGTGGGVTLTIAGNGFGTNLAVVHVTIAGTPCTVTSVTDNQILCTTGQHTPSQKTSVRVEINGNGIADWTNAGFYYVDVWSSPFTWGYGSPPEDGTLVVIPAGNVILLDQNTNRLKMVLIKGGELIFDEKDVELFADNILIVEGGKLQIGTKDQPFQHKAIITGIAHLRTKELPIYGTNSIGVREGILDLHGQPVPVVWTRLDQTSLAGSNQIVVQEEVTWKSGDQVVIATTGHRHSQRENEMRTIQSVASDKKTITLTESLDYTHVGVEEIIGARTLHYRAEVGLLTRNIVLRGERDPQWTEVIEACPNGFDTGEFATQTCFQGRFGEEIGSDQFGLQVMLHPPEPNKDLAIGRVSYVEFTYVGQAFRLGRYPFHFHLGGNMSSSYIIGCALHETFNRAVNIHGTHSALVENNVIYNVMGGAFFLEDGIETENRLINNLAVFVRESSSLLNDDITPAAYWVTNPNNIIINNTAAGGTHFGFWYRMHAHPGGPSRTSSVCPQKELLGAFEGNTAHSSGWYGLWIFDAYFPKVGGHCGSNTPAKAIFKSFYAWNCKKGSEVVNTGLLQFHDCIFSNNAEAGHDQTSGGEGIPFSQDGPMFKDGLIVGSSSVIPGGCTAGGIIVPFSYTYLIDGTEFANFNGGCACIRSNSGVSSSTGGYMIHTNNLKFTNVGTTNRGNFRWQHELLVYDNDGSLTGTANTTVVPSSGFNPPSCVPFNGFSNGAAADMCPDDVKFIRFSFNDISPKSLEFKNINFHNEYGSSTAVFQKFRVTHNRGWMALIPSRHSYDMEFIGGNYKTNISFSGTMSLFKEDDYFIFNMYVEDPPDCVTFGGGCVDEVEGPLDGEVNYNGDWTYNSTSQVISYIVSKRHRGSGRKKRSTSSPSWSGSTIGVRYKSYKCFYVNCTVPVRPGSIPPNFNMSSAEVDGRLFWSDESSWFNNTLPEENSSVIIDHDKWLVADTEIPPLYELIIYGMLEFDHGNGTGGYRDFVLNTTYLVILGGRLVIGWENEPFLGNVHIILQGTLLTEEFILPWDDYVKIGSKVIGVYGGLDLHGKPVSIPWTALATTVYEGETTITVNGEVDWFADQDIVIAPTGFSPWETETFRITDISFDNQTSTSTIALNDTIKFRHLAYSDGTVSIIAEVGLLTRNIKIEGGDYDQLYNESFGGRIIIGDSSHGRGYARISDVEFYHMGQQGFMDEFDPRYVIAYVDSGPVTPLKPSYIKNNAFHHSFSPAIGVYNAHNMEIEDNVIHHSVYFSIQTTSDNTQIRRNMVTLVKWKGEPYDGAISATKATGLTLTGNRVSGSERLAYHLPLFECSTPAAEWYSDNVARSSLIGTASFSSDPGNGCNKIAGLTIIKSAHMAIYYQRSESVIFEGLLLVDNRMGIVPFIIGPASSSHAYANKSVIIKNTKIYGTTSTFDCSRDKLTNADKNMKSASQSNPVGSGHVGVMFTTFNSAGNGAPSKSFYRIKKYQSIMGLTALEDVTFSDFYSKCAGDVLVITNPINDDGAHPVETRRITINNSPMANRIHLHRPNLGKINPADCVDMDCDGLKKAFLKDIDGTFLGSPGAVIPQSEWQWGGDPRRGLGDYRVPKTLQTKLDGTRIPMSELAPIKGVIREGDCTYHSSWQAYECHQYNYEMLTIESMDSDSESRRLSPVAILGHNEDGDGCLDLINGPQDHGWCSGYACKKRLSTFQAIVATGKDYIIHFTSTSPQKLRYLLLNANSTQGVRLGVWYSQPYRLDVYYGGQHVMPVNGRWKYGAYILDPPPVGQPLAYMPDAIADPAGTNWYDRDSGTLYLIVKGPANVNVKTTKLIIVNYQYPAMTVTQFYGEKIVEYLAAFFDLPPSKVRVVDIVSADQSSGRRRRKRSTGNDEIIVEIGDAPTNTSDEVSSDSLTLEKLQAVYALAVEEGQLGNFSMVLNGTVLGVSIVQPTPDPSSDEWASITTSEGYRVLVQIDHLGFQTKITPLHEGTPFTVQPKINVFDVVGNRINELGTSVYPWYVTASIREGTGNPSAYLIGNTTIQFVEGWANFTNLGIDYFGTGYIIDFNITSPDKGENLTLQSDPIDIPKRPIKVIVASNTEVYESTFFGAKIQLGDELTGEIIKDIQWNGLTWHVTASIPMPELYNGTIEGVTSTTFDPLTSEANFYTLKLTKFGMAVIKFHVTTSPEVYDLYVEHLVPIKGSHHIGMTVEETTEVVLKSGADYNTVVGNDDKHVASLLGNWFSHTYPDIMCENVSVSRGSIVVTVTVSGTHDDVNSTLYSACSVISNGQSFTFNGNTFSLSNSMVYNGSTFYGGDCYVAPKSEDSNQSMNIAIIVAAVCCVICVVLIFTLVILWRLKVRPKTKIYDEHKYGTKYLDHDDLEEILFREKSFMSIKNAPISTKIPYKN